jgi:hypothetical protein
MPKQSAAWWVTIGGIESLLERNDFAEELPPRLRTLVKKLDFIEGKHLHSFAITSDQASMNKKIFDDWTLCT